MLKVKKKFSTLQIACEMTELQGGPTRSALDVTSYLPSPHNFAVVGKIDSSTFLLLKASGVSPHIVRSNFRNKSGFCFRDLPKLIGLIRSHEVIISHGFYTLPTLISCFVGWEKSIYVMPHGSLEEYQWAHGRFKKVLFDNLIKLSTNFQNLTFTVATVEESRSIKQKFKSNRVEVVGIGVDLPNPQEIQVREEGSSISLLSISRITAKKRIDISIKALSLMKEVLPNPQLLIYGSGDFKLLTSLKKLVSDLNLKEFIHFKGTVDHRDIAKVFKKADILLLPSENENFAIAVAESIVHNVPVIVTTDVALSSFVAENHCGEVINSPDPYLLMEAILKVSSNLDRYRLACEVSRHKLGHSEIKRKWAAVLGISD